MLFEQALSYDPSLLIEPEKEAKWLAAPRFLINEGRTLASAGSVDEAIALFEQALAYDPTLNLIPEVEAKRLAAPELVRQGRMLARAGNRKAAIAQFTQAIIDDPALELEPELTAQIEYAIGLINNLEYGRALLALDAAQILSPTLAITDTLAADDWYDICRTGSLAGGAEVVLPHASEHWCWHRQATSITMGVAWPAPLPEISSAQ